MWTVAHYTPVALFSLRSAAATSSGGKTLICPTPFSVKMALLDALIRTRGQANGKQWWLLIRSMRLRVQLPAQLSVINTFTKIVRPKKNGASDDDGSGLIAPLGRTIAYREYVSYGGSIAIAAQTDVGQVLPEALASLFAHITYLGKRGGFMQLQAVPEIWEDTAFDTTWVTVTDNQSTFTLDGTLQMLDDCGPKMTFDHADIYNDKRMTLGKERVLRHIVLPYRLTRSSRGFSLYERISL